jgi:acyl-CoA synthetase (NDP forming)
MDKTAIAGVLAAVKASGRTSLTAPEAKALCDACAITVPKEGLATSAKQATTIADEIGYPVVMKVVSPDILHKTEAGGVIANLTKAAEVRSAYKTIVSNAKSYAPSAHIMGVQVQQMVTGAQEVIVGSVTDPSFGKLVAFGMGGVLVEVLKDVTFRLAPATREEAISMINGIRASEILGGVRGAAAVNQEALASLICSVSQLVHEFPEITEVDLNPVFASADGAVAADVRIIVNFNPPTARFRPSQGEILSAMNRIMRPDSIAVIGASAEDGKIGNSVMRNLIDGGYQGAIYPIHPRLDEVLGKKAYRSVKDIAGPVDVAVFAIPARAVAGALAECGEKQIPGAVLIPSGFAETGNQDLQDEIVKVARQYNIRLMGPNIYGFYYTPKNLCATFCTPYDVKGQVALSSQSGGVGMAIVGFSRSTRMGVSAIVGLGNKSDIDEDDLLTFFEQDDNTQAIAMHFEDLKDGRAFAEAAHRVAKHKPVIALKAGRTAMGARAARSHTAALAGDDRVYEDVLKQSGVVRARSLNDMLQFARCLPMLPAPQGENVVIITGAGGSGVLLADACSDWQLQLMAMPPDLDEAFKKFIPPFGASGNPVDITGGEPPTTYRNTIALGLEDRRIHALILGYWHTIITPPMVFASLVSEVVEEYRAKGINKPVVASLVGDVEVEEASRHLFDHNIPAYPYTTELPVAVLGAKYQWARRAGLV